MPGKKKSTGKLGLFSDLVTLAASGWTPEETGKILDRLETIGDINNPMDENQDFSPEEHEEAEEENIVLPFSEDDEDDTPEESEDDEKDDKDDISKNLDKMKNIGLEVENTRLKKEIEKLQAINRAKDISGQTNAKTPEDALIDAFQSCF